MNWSRRNRRVTLRWVYWGLIFAAAMQLTMGCGAAVDNSHPTESGDDFKKDLHSFIVTDPRDSTRCVVFIYNGPEEGSDMQVVC